MAGGKRQRKHHTEEAPEETPETTTSKETTDWFGKTTDVLQTIFTSKYTLILLVLIPIILAGYFRLYPTSLPATDDWAANTMDQSLRAQIEQQVRADRPFLPAEEVRSFANEQLRVYKAQNQAAYDSQVNQLSQQFKSRLQRTIEKPDGSTYEQTYLIAIDPYYYLRRAENVHETGTVCDEIQDGECMDTSMIAPNGTTTKNDFHSWMGALFISIAAMFGYAGMTGFFFLPAVFSALATIPAFFIVKRRFGAFAGLVSGLIVGLHGAFLGRTPAGFVDTDVWNVFFPLYIIWLLMIGMDRKDKWGYISIAGAGILAALYSKFWAGWYFTYIILWLVLLGSAVFALIRYFFGRRTEHIKKDERQSLIAYSKRAGIDLGIFTLVTGIFTTIISGFRAFINAYLQPVNISIGLQDPVGQGLWPNVLTTVAELNQASLGSIVNQLGGRWLFLLAAVGVCTYVLRGQKKDWKEWLAVAGIILYYFAISTKEALALGTFTYLALFILPMIGTLIYAVMKKESLPAHYALFTMGWLVAGIFATTQGTRFLLLLVPIYAICIGFAVGWIKEILPPILKKELSIPTFWGSALVVVIIGALLFTPVSANMIGAAHAVSKGEVPSMNDAWWNSLTAIKEDSHPDAIVTSWWDFGHWFKYVTERRVTFDGASQKGELAHWVGRLFQTDDERYSIGILRMIHCGGDQAYYALDAEFQDARKSYKTIEALIGASPEDARETLEDAGASLETTEKVLGLTHCSLPENYSYVIVSEDMIGKAGVWGHFGLWDVDKSFVYETTKGRSRNEAITIIANKLGVTEGEASTLYNEVTTQPNRRAINTWISPWPGYGGRSTCQRQNETITCRLGLGIGQQQGVNLVADTMKINLSAVNETTITITAQGQNVGDIKPDYLNIDGEEYDLGGDFTLGIRVMGNQLTIADEKLVNSMFTKLFYEEDAGDYLEFVDKETQVTGGKIIVYKVDWAAYEEAIAQ